MTLADKRLRSQADTRRRLRELQAHVDALQQGQSDVAKEESRAWVRPAALSSLITLLVALIAVWGTWSATHFGAGEDREKESRERRAKIYADYLESARNYQVEQVSLVFAELLVKTDESAAAHASPSKKLAAQKSLEVATRARLEAVAKAAKARAAFEKQADLVYVYGSDAAWKVQARIQDRLLRGPGAPSSVVGDDFREFQAVFCHEASATPRNGCDG
jgi:hypothetical protein